MAYNVNTLFRIVGVNLSLLALLISSGMCYNATYAAKASRH